MDSSDTLRKAITRTYVIAFSVIALLMTGFFVYSQHSAAANAWLPAMINKAGMQRMLSQRIALLSHTLVHSTPAATEDALREELQQQIDTFLDNHSVLSGAVREHTGAFRLSEDLQQHYFDGLLSLDNVVKRYAARASRLATTPLAELSPSMLPSAQETERLLERLDRAVSLYETLLNDRLNTQRRTETLAWLALVIAMLGAVFFLFKPLEKLVINQFLAREDAQKAAEQERVNADTAHQVQAKFLTKMSHEFRTHISAVIGALELMPNMRNKQDVLIQQAGQACYRLLTVTNNLLDMIGLPSQDSAKEEVQFDLIRLIEECIAPVSAMCRNKQLEFSMHNHSPLPQFVEGRPLEISKALKNVLDNAVKFTDKGFVRVTTELKVHQGHFLFTIIVTDSGIGINESQLEHIFERFYQVDEKTNRHQTGPGLGLTVALQQLQNIQGNITVSSQADAGSTFTITVPLKPSKVKPAPPAQRAHAVFAVVDDLEISRLYLKNLIESEGFHAECFESGTELLARREQVLSYTAIIADYYMPGISGAELANTVTAMHGKKTPPLVIMSATPEIANIIATSTIPTWQVLVKPVDRTRFIDTLWQLASPRHQRRSIPNGNRILVVEDEPVNAEIASNMLQNLGYRTVIAQNGEDALVALNNQEMDLILLDINLPDMNGLEVAKIARESGLRIPIIAATANAYESDRTASELAGIRYHLVKPISYQELKNTLKLALSLDV